MRIVDDSPGERREVRRRECRADQKRSQQGDDERARPEAKHASAPVAGQNFTFGAAWASASAVNGTSGLIERNTVLAQITLGKVRSVVLKSCTAAM